MRFRNFLNEIAMNQRVFADTSARLGSSARVGFEFELIVPKEADFHGGGSNDEPPLKLTDLTTLGDFEEYFEPRSKFSKIHDDYKRWVDNPDDDITSFYEFIIDNFRTPAAFVAHYKLFPVFGWKDKGISIYTQPEDDRANTTTTGFNLKSSLSKIVNSPIKVSASHNGEKKSTTSWYVEPDESIEPEDGGHGLELVSPPLLLDDALEVLPKVLAWMKKHGLKTNASTGFHINVSIPNIEKKLDPVKLVLFMGEEYVAKAFNRLTNSFTQTHISSILDGVKQYGRIPSSATDMISFAQKYLRSAKYSSVNISYLPRGYLEFRVAGGVDYHTDLSKLKKTVLRFVTAVELACDPSAERQEYLKKLSNVFNRAKDQIQSVTKDDAHLLPESLHRLYKYNADIMDLWKTYMKAAGTGIQSAARHSAVALGYTALDTAKNFKTSLSLKEKLELKKIFKTSALQSADVDAYYGSDHLGRLAFKKEFGL